MDKESFKDMIHQAVEHAFDELDLDDVSMAAQLAHKVKAGEITEEHALRALRRYAESKGYDTPNLDERIGDRISEVAYEVATGQMVDVTEKVKKALVEAGEPGLADAFVQIKVPIDRPTEDTHAAVAISAKAWLNWEGCTPTEMELIRRAVKLAAESEGIRWMP